MHKLVRICLSTVVSVVVTASVAVPVTAQHGADAQREFQLAATLIDDYRHDVLGQQVEVMDAPQVALPVTFESTIDALIRMRDMEVQACFAEWWAHEYVSLKLAAMFTLYMQEGTTEQAKVDHTGWLADRLHEDAQKMRASVYDDCALPPPAA